jgi:hypothetical protein
LRECSRFPARGGDDWATTALESRGLSAFATGVQR